jgi:hypothetical protein
MLTLAFPYTERIAGRVVRYRVTPELAERWQELTKRHANENKQLPYADLSRALRCVLGDFAAVQRGPGERGETFILARREVPNAVLTRLFAEFESELARRHQVPFRGLLAPLMTDLRPETVDVGAYLDGTGPTGEPDIPGWVYDVATWHAIELLASRALRLPSGRQLPLRADTDGNLLAWDDLLPAQHGDRAIEPAMHYVTLTPITLPGYPGLLLSLDAHISRLTYFWPNARTTWLATDNNRLVLTAAIRYDRGTGQRILAGNLAQLVDVFSLRGIPLLDEEILRREPQRARARYAATPGRHAVGAGVGRKFLDVLLNHATTCLPQDSIPLELVDSTIRGVDRSPTARKDPFAPGDRTRLADTLRNANRRLHLLVLFSSDDMRARSTRAIARALNISPPDLERACDPSGSGELIDGRLRVSFVYADTAELLAPGDPDPRQRIATRLAAAVHEGWTGAVLAETDTAQALADNVTPRQDPKRQGRRANADRQLVSQYLDAASAPGVSKHDHPADAALLDLLRSTGLTGTLHRRVFAAPLQPMPTVLVGIYSRTQTKPTTRMISLAAVVTDGTDRPWTTLAYHLDAGGWASYAQATVAHHAGPISPFDATLGYDARNARAAAYVQRALNQLLVRFPDIPMVLFVDGVGGRALWPGLANKNLGLTEPGALPHLGLGSAEPGQVALVRVVSSDDDQVLPQPVRATGPHVEDETSGFVPASTKLYRLAASKKDAYYLINRSRTDQAYDFAVRDGHRKTRFDIAEQPRVLRTPWHAMTCTEFTILDAGSWSTDQLAALAARLCGHPLAWDGRTARPIPLHLARQVLDDHPDRT